MKLLKRSISAMLILAMLLSTLCIGVFAADIQPSEFTLNGAEVTVNGTEDKTVNIVFSSNEGTPVISLFGKFELSTEAQKYITLSGYECPVELNGTSNAFSTGTGELTYSDDVNFTGYTVAAGGNVFTATYTVSKDTPTGEYDVYFKNVELSASISSYFSEADFSATIKVTNTYKPDVPATSVTLNKNTLDLTVGSSETLTANVLPVDATNKDVTWESSDTDVAAVDENGKVTAVKAGKATITVSVKSNPELTDTCEVTVTDQIFPVTGVALTPDKAELYVGEKKNLTVVFTPSNATNKNVTWESSNTAVATVADGVVTAVGKGTASITVTTADGNHTATCEVTVKIPVSSVTLNPTSTALVVGDTKQLTASVEPENADDSTVVWSSSNTKVATVDQTGLVTAVGAGTATITAAAGGKSATCKVTVSIKPVPIEGIALADAEVYVGRTVQLEPVFKPANTTQRDVTWSSSDKTIATVDANGSVKGIAEGKATITVTSTANPAITASCTVTVTRNLGEDLAPIIAAIGNGSLPFTDVSVRDYYYNAVKWAVDNGITSGTSRNTFSPDTACTRAQVVTFLWRAAGCPQPVSMANPFTDIHADDYFYEAVLWAVENGITKGTSAKTFSPDATVTRAQVVTFLWRANGQPAAASSGFADVRSNDYYANAVDWAFANGVTTGVTDTAFGPGAACTRAQIVTFLYRAK